MPNHAQCTASATRPCSIAVLPRLLHEIQTRNRLDQRTEQWQRRYAIRAGIEATFSQNVRVHGLRGSRYRGLAPYPPPARSHRPGLQRHPGLRLDIQHPQNPPPHHAAFTRSAQPPHDLANLTNRVTALVIDLRVRQVAEGPGRAPFG
ncbi:transposase [Streptomyces sp. NPDC001276]|uniref:transposase n=1 Tax=Streptomyces sp. NPDC001276 TaxID=3364555 RepID=UPI003683BE0B